MAAIGVDLVYRRLLWSDYYGYDYYGYYGWTTAGAHTKPDQAKAIQKKTVHQLANCRPIMLEKLFH